MTTPNEAFQQWWSTVPVKRDHPYWLVMSMAHSAWHAALAWQAEQDGTTSDTLAHRRLDAHERSIHALNVLLEQILKRLASLEQQQPDPCADGFCPVSMFQPVDDTEGSA